MLSLPPCPLVQSAGCAWVTASSRYTAKLTPPPPHNSRFNLFSCSEGFFLTTFMDQPWSWCLPSVSSVTRIPSLWCLIPRAVLDNFHSEALKGKNILRDTIYYLVFTMYRSLCSAFLCFVLFSPTKTLVRCIPVQWRN